METGESGRHALISVSFGPQEWSTTSSPTTFPSPSPTCLVQMSKTESLPKGKGEQAVGAGPQSSLAPTRPPPDSSMEKIHTKINSQQCREIRSSPVL